MSRTATRLRHPHERAARGAERIIGAPAVGRWGARNMKFMLMMNAPRGNGDWAVADWSPDDLKAHVGFMKRFAESLQKEGALVGAEGLASPGQARIVRAGKGGAPEVTDGPFPE